MRENTHLSDLDELDEFPLRAVHVVGDVPLDAHVDQVQLVGVEGPRGKGHGAVLLVVGEVLDVDGTGALEDDHGQPGHVAVMSHDGIGTHRLPRDGGTEERRTHQTFCRELFKIHILCGPPWAIKAQVRGQFSQNCG